MEGASQGDIIISLSARIPLAEFTAGYVKDSSSINKEKKKKKERIKALRWGVTARRQRDVVQVRLDADLLRLLKASHGERVVVVMSTSYQRQVLSLSTVLYPSSFEVAGFLRPKRVPLRLTSDSFSVTLPLGVDRLLASLSDCA